MSEPLIQVQIDQKSLDRAKKVLEKYQGRSFEERLRRGTLQAARMLVPSIRAAAPVVTGNLRSSVKAWTVATSAGVKTLSARVGPSGAKGAHRHLVIRGHRIVTPGGRDTGRRTSPNPFVDAAVASRIDDAMREVSKILFGP